MDSGIQTKDNFCLAFLIPFYFEITCRNYNFGEDELSDLNTRLLKHDGFVNHRLIFAQEDPEVFVYSLCSK